MKVVATVAGHLDLLEYREQDTRFGEPFYAERIKTLVEYATTGTVVSDGRIIGVIGYMIMWPGVAEVYLIPSKYLPEYALPFARLVKRYLASIVSSHNLHRLQTASPSDELHDQWMTFLGFTCEGTLKEFTQHKQDYKQWALLCSAQH